MVWVFFVTRVLLAGVLPQFHRTWTCVPNNGCQSQQAPWVFHIFLTCIFRTLCRGSLGNTRRAGMTVCESLGHDSQYISNLLGTFCRRFLCRFCISLSLSFCGQCRPEGSWTHGNLDTLPSSTRISSDRPPFVYFLGGMALLGGVLDSKICTCLCCRRSTSRSNSLPISA